MILSGGTLRTPWLASNSSNVSWLNNRAFILFAGTRIVATQNETQFIRLAGGANYANENFAVLDGTSTFDTAGYNIGIGVQLRGFGGMVKDGAGKLTLSGTNTYGGVTRVVGGSVELTQSGSLAGNVEVAAGTSNAALVATFAGNGSVAGNVVLMAESSAGLRNGGQLAPTAGTSGAALNVAGTTTFNAGSVFEWSLNTSSVGADPGANTANAGQYGQLNGSGTISGADAIFKVVLAAGSSFADSFWDTNKVWNNVITGSGATLDLASIFSRIDGSQITFNSGVGVVDGRGHFSLIGSNTLSWTAVPVPSNALAGLLVGAMFFRRRRSH